MAAELQQSLGLDARLLPGSKGVFDVTVGGKLVFSKHSEGRFPEPGEVSRRLQGNPPPGGS